ncbi:MAG TPA: response regulator [Kofleriaceae bacterium]|nr:response regulator [Kofleriaceae bacterium]
MSFASTDLPDEVLEPGSGKHTVLVVDPDRVSQRAVEAALAPFGWEVEGVKNGAGALDVLRQQHVDAIIAEVALDDMQGRALIDRTWEVCGSSIPVFVFLTSDLRVETRASVLRGGAEACMTKPFAPEELRAHLDGSLIRRNREHQEPLAPTVAIAGQAEQLDVIELLGLLERGRHTGVFEMAVGSVLGKLSLREGQLLDAEFGSARGVSAFHSLLRCERGIYRFDVRLVDGAPAIGRSLSDLLAEARRDGRLRATRTRGLAELGVVKREIPLHRHRSSAAEQRARDRRALAQRLIGPAADRYLLGELSFEEPEPHVWERLYDECLLIELWAGLRDGIAALLELATPPGRDALVSVLSGTAQGLRLYLSARAGASLMIRLVDIEGSEAPPRRFPADVIVVAPPHGELLAISPSRLAELAMMATLDRMPRIVGMGGAALHASLGRLAIDRAAFELFDFTAALGERRGQLRDVLVTSFRRWIA